MYTFTNSNRIETGKIEIQDGAYIELELDSRMKKHKVTLYVRSAKTVIGTEDRSKWGYVGGAGVRGGYRIIPDYKVYSEAEYKHVLSEDQKNIVEIVQEIARKYGLEIRVIDVALENPLDRLLQEEVKKIRVFPTLITDTGERLEGQISKEQIETLLANLPP
jgi:nitrogen regulatory protein PII-like uncharacterized protein